MNVSAIAFLLVGLLAGLLAFMGLLSAVKGTPVHTVGALPAGDQPGVDSRAFRDAMELVSRTSLAPGHAIEIFANGDETYPRLWADLRGARESITMQMYYCEAGRMVDMLREILIERAGAGIRVMMLYDAFGTSFPKEYIQALESAGVQAVSFRPLRPMGARTVQNRAHMRVASATRGASAFRTSGSATVATRINGATRTFALRAPPSANSRRGSLRAGRRPRATSS